MPIVKPQEVTGCDEVAITVTFIDTPAERAFKRALIESFTEDKRKLYVTNGDPSALIDCIAIDGNTIILQGLAEDLNVHFHSPPLIVPDSVKPKEFWAAGDAIYAGGIDSYRKSHGVYSPSRIPLAEQVISNREDIALENSLGAFITALRENRVSVHGDTYLVGANLYDPHCNKRFFIELQKLKTQPGFPLMQFQQLEEKRVTGIDNVDTSFFR